MRPGRGRRPAVVPDQHGAWAFLVLPLVLASTQARPSWLLAPLAVAWVAAYPLSWAALGVLAAPRPERFRTALRVWLVPVLGCALVLVVARPWLFWVGLAYLALFLVHLRYAAARNERSLANDLVLIFECTAMVPISIAAPHGLGWAIPWHVLTRDVLALSVLCCLVLTGSVLHVKSLIRERGNPRFVWVSQAFATACVPVSAVVVARWGRSGVVAVVLAFTLLALRTFLVRGRVRPALIGLVELGALVVLAAAVIVAAP